MKRPLQTAFALVSLLATLSFSLAGCSTSTGSSDTPATQDPATQTPTTLTVFNSSIPTMADLVGTWVSEISKPAEDKTDADGDGDTLEDLGTWTKRLTRVITMTDSTHGTYLEVTISAIDYPDATGIADTASYTGRKGTIELSSGVITVAQTHWISPSSTPLDITTVASATWTAYAYTKTANCAIIGGKLFTEVFKRTGAGTGIEGTWLDEMTEAPWNYRFTHTYTATTFTSESQSGQSGTYGSVSTKNYPYTVTSATSIHITNASDDWDQTVYLGTNVVALPDEEYGWVKQ